MMRLNLKPIMTSLFCLALAAHAVAADHEEDGRDPGAAATIETLPDHRGGQESIGRPWTSPDFDRFVVPDDPSGESAEEASPRDDTPPVTLYRWWTNGCPFCESSLPAIDSWREQFGPQGLRIVAVYHPKPPRDVSDALVRDAARTMGYHGEIAIDADWSTFHELTREWNNRRATSVSFLVDHEGVIQFVHPGPDFYPRITDGEDGESDALRTRQHRDHALLEAAITTLLDQRRQAVAAEKD